MRIVNCYIENFGTLREFSYDFTEGLNTIHEMNGWGKTTFAVFIKSMFYGLEYEPRKKVKDNERKRYFPWQGGNFGGNLTFEVDGRQYKIERFFGKRDKEDTFALYDVATGLISEAYSENLGEELFRIDRASYERSTYIPQSAIDVTMTDSINAKLGNLIENGNDINNYESAIAVLEEHLKEYKKTGQRGRLPELQEKIFAKEQELEECRNKSDAIQLIEEQIEQEQVMRRGLSAKREELKGEVRKASEHKEKAAKLEHYEFIKKQIAETTAKLDPLDKIFYKGMPEYDELEDCGAKIEELNRMQSQKNNGQLTEIEQEKLAGLKDFFAEGAPILADIEACITERNQVQELENEIVRVNGRLEILAQTKRQLERDIAVQTSRRSPLWIVGVIIMILGGILGFLTPISIMVGMIIIAVGVLVLMAGLFHKASPDEQLTKQVRQAVEEECELKKQLQQLTSDRETADLNYQKFLDQYPGEYKEENPLQFLSELQTRSIEYQDLTEREAHYQVNLAAVETKIAETEDAVTDYLNRYGVLVADEELQSGSEEYRRLLKEAHQTLRDNCMTYARLQENLEKQEAEKKEFEEENHLTEEDSVNITPEDAATLEELQSQEKEYEVAMAAIDEKINSYRKDIDNLCLIVDTQSDIEAELAALKEEQQEARDNYGILEKTIKYLKQAKESFSIHYMGAMSEGFAKYAKFISGHAMDDIKLDISLEAQLDIHGTMKGSEYFSTGNKDFVGICIHLALVDALFENERPFIILDDPFVNLDEEKIANAKKMLAQIAEQYQIIYFTCHSSRNA